MKFHLLILFFGISGILTHAHSQEIRFLIGTTDRSDSAGIYSAVLSPATGTISITGLTRTAPAPGYISFSPDKKALFIVTGDQKVSSYSISNGKLSLVNSQPAEGLNPCHVSVHPSGKMAFIANYSDGSFSAYQVKGGTTLTPAVYKEKYEGSGPDQNRQKAPHAHCAVVSPNGNFVYVADLGTDRVMNYRVNGKSGTVQPNQTQPYFTVHPGAGPRHLVVHQSGKWLFLLNELDATLTSASIGKNGALTLIDTYPTLPGGKNQPGNTSAAIRMHPNGKFVYVSNRGYDAIQGFRIESDGRLTRVTEARQKIGVPRDFNLDPSGKFLIVGNQKTNDLTVLSVDPSTGELTYRSTSERVPSPSCIEFF